MILQEFARIVSALAEQHPDDEVVIQTYSGSGMPHRWLEPVKNLVPGFDWTRGRCIIYTEQPLVLVKVLTQHVRDLAKETLDKLQQYHAKLHPDTRYIPKAREAEWLDGFCHGISTLVTAVYVESDEHD